MSLDLRLPNITAQDERGQLQQMRSYLYQMVEQLNFAMRTVGTEAGTVAAAQLAVSTGVSGAAADPASTFAGIKALIIKSADIVNAYYDQINERLEGLYVAQSDFGVYAEETALEIQGNSENIQQLYTNEQTIAARVDGLSSNTSGLTNRVAGLESESKQLSDSLDELYAQSILTNAYIKTGLLYYAPDGTPVYGLEVGQTNSVGGEQVFDKFARFSADRLSFFDRNDVEVAYISDYKLYITNAEITGNLFLSGRFKIYYKNGLAFQWTGGSS